MGGHGGLNILPQKKWNVYNHDNRAIVDRDKKIAENKKKEKYEKDRVSALEGKLQVLRQENGITHTDTFPEQLTKTLNDQFRKLNESAHINLFEHEQKIIENREMLEMKKLQEAEFLKDKNMDYSSKFLGTYSDGNKKSPWYAREKGFNDQKKRPSQISHLISVKKSDSHTLEEVIKLQAKQEKQEREKSPEYERSREKLRLKLEPKSQIQILREKRLKRQQKQRERTQKLKEKVKN